MVGVRAAVLEEDRDGILAVLSRNLSSAGSRARFDWLYRSNPAGSSLAWVAEDSSTGKIVGTSAAHPKKIWMNGQVETVLNLSDFAFDRAYRTLGPALKLLRASLRPVDDGTYALSYDHPSAAMAALYARLGRRPLAPWRRYVRRLRLDDLAHARFGDRPLVDVGLFGAHLAIQLRDRIIDGRSHGFEVTSEVPSVTELDRVNDAWRPTRYRVARPASYVMWRFVQNVMWKHGILAAYAKGGRLAGYLIHRDGEHDTIKVLDLVAPSNDVSVARALLGAVLGIARRKRKRGLAVTLLAHSPAERLIERLGFWKRQDGPGVVIWSRTDSVGLDDPSQWWMLEGDEDV